MICVINFTYVLLIIDSFIVTELYNGTLDDLVKRRRRRYKGPPVGNNWLILRQTVEGLRHLHDNNIIHRDLQPRNILISISKEIGDRPVIKLTDFGMSRIIQENQSHLLTQTQLMKGYSIEFRAFGTDGWIAPEVLKGQRTFTESVDIFPLGLIFAFTLSGGLHPFDVDPPNDEETNEKTIQRSMKRNERIRKGESMTLTSDQLKDDDRLAAFDLIQSMLSHDPNNRPSADLVLQHKYFQRNQKVDYLFNFS